MILIIWSTFEYVEQLKLLQIAGGQKKAHALWKTVWQFRINLSTYVSSDSVVLLSWEIITCVYRKIYTWILILNCPELETTQMPFNWQLHKQTIAYWHNEILHKIKMRQTIDTRNNMDRSQKKKKNLKDAIYITISKWHNYSDEEKDQWLSGLGMRVLF